jgi:Dolichyl-phosphate-mannose-protein mannosyltransferase
MTTSSSEDMASTTRLETATAPQTYFKTILAVAFILRLGVALLMLLSHPRQWLFNNASDLGYLAQSLSSGNGLSSPFGGSTGPSALVTPGYPLLIALIFRTCGTYSFSSALVIVGLQILFAVLTVAVMMHISNRLFGAMTANVAGGLWAVSLPLLWLPTLFWETCLSTLLLTGSIAFAIHILDKPGKSMWLLAGLYCGCTFLVNPALSLAMVAIFAWPAFQMRPVSLIHPMLGFFVLLLVFAPWPLRNLRVMHVPVLLRSTFGYELWQGNRPGGDGTFDDALYPLRSKSEYVLYASRGEVAYMSEKSALAEAYIRAEPKAFLMLTVKRIVRFWIGTRENENLVEVEVQTVPTLVFGLLGMLLLWRKNASVAALFLLPLILFPLPYYITDVRFRYRFVIDPVMTMFAAYAGARIIVYFKRRARAS